MGIGELAPRSPINTAFGSNRASNTGSFNLALDAKIPEVLAPITLPIQINVNHPKPPPPAIWLRGDEAQKAALELARNAWKPALVGGKVQSSNGNSLPYTDLLSSINRPENDKSSPNYKVQATYGNIIIVTDESLGSFDQKNGLNELGKVNRAVAMVGKQIHEVEKTSVGKPILQSAQSNLPVVVVVHSGSLQDYKNSSPLIQFESPESDLDKNKLERNFNKVDLTPFIGLALPDRLNND